MNKTKAVFHVTKQSTLSKILEAFRNSDEDLVLVDENTIISPPHLELLTDYPRSSSAALVAKAERDKGDTLIRLGKVISASSASHTASITNKTFVGALRLSQNQRAEILATFEVASKAGAKGHALDLCLVALVRATVSVDAVEFNGAPWARSESEEVRKAAEIELGKVSQERIRLRLANRANDGFYSVFVLRRFSKLLTWVAVKIGATPNQVTITSFFIGLLSAYMFSRGDFWSIVVGAIALQASIVVDCVDGELARYTRKFSQLGAWLDAITDRVKEYLVFLGLVLGAISSGNQNLWVPAMAMMALQTFRHLSDYNFGQVVRARAAETPRQPIDFMAESDGVELERSAPSSRFRYWAGKVVIFPIGERWLVISLSAIIGGAGFTFTVLPIFALISLVWVFKVRIGKSLAMAKERIQSLVISRQLDFAVIKLPLTKRFDWAEPSILRAIELGLLIWLFAATGNLGISAFFVLFAIVFHHYDNLYRAMQNESKPTWLKVMGLTIFGRLVILLWAATSGWNLEFFAWYFNLALVLVSSVQWVISHRKNG